jgi:hypothetical protein
MSSGLNHRVRHIRYCHTVRKGKSDVVVRDEPISSPEQTHDPFKGITQMRRKPWESKDSFRRRRIKAMSKRQQKCIPTGKVKHSFDTNNNRVETFEEEDTKVMCGRIGPRLWTRHQTEREDVLSHDDLRSAIRTDMKPLRKMIKAELFEECKARGVKAFKSWKKQKMLDALEADIEDYYRYRNGE